MNITILRFDSLPSTNTEALNQAKRGANEGLCIVAGEQTAGRGRHGRNWISTENAGLYFSIVLRPQFELRFLPLLTLMSAVAVYDVLQKVCRINPDIKWVNDVLVNDKKICGILAETVETESNLAVIIGIGINLKASKLPEITNIATSIEEETKINPEIENLLENLIQTLSEWYRILQGENGAAIIRDEWTRRSTYAFGQEVSVNLENEMIYGITRGIEENGALRIETASSEIKIIHAGDVKKLRKTESD